MIRTQIYLSKREYGLVQREAERRAVWDRPTGTVVYDNVLGASDDMDAANPQALGGGSIVVQKGK